MQMNIGSFPIQMKLLGPVYKTWASRWASVFPRGTWDRHKYGTDAFGGFDSSTLCCLKWRLQLWFLGCCWSLGMTLCQLEGISVSLTESLLNSESRNFMLFSADSWALVFSPLYILFQIEGEYYPLFQKSCKSFGAMYSWTLPVVVVSVSTRWLTKQRERWWWWRSWFAVMRKHRRLFWQR